MKTISTFAQNLKLKQDARDKLLPELFAIEAQLQTNPPRAKTNALLSRRATLSALIGSVNADIKALCVQEQLLAREYPDETTLARIARGLASCLTARKNDSEVKFSPNERAHVEALSICLGDKPRPQRKSAQSADTLAILDAMIART